MGKLRRSRVSKECRAWDGLDFRVFSWKVDWKSALKKEKHR
jgi:hypothetical protein